MKKNTVELKIIFFSPEFAVESRSPRLDILLPQDCRRGGLSPKHHSHSHFLIDCRRLVMETMDTPPLLPLAVVAPPLRTGLRTVVASCLLSLVAIQLFNILAFYGPLEVGLRRSGAALKVNTIFH